MSNDLAFPLENCLIVCGIFLVLGLPFQMVATYLARDEFRSKGFLQIPWGLEWVPFLLRRRYDLFENGIARSLFSLSHVCALGMIFSLSAGALLIGCDLLLKSIS